MTNLEFIEKELKSTERRIQELKKDLSFAITHNREDEFLDLDSDIEYYENLLNHLQQIKSELEAWEICKKYHHINKYDGKRFDITIWLNTENCDFKSCASYEECLKVKKALEVK
jgi:hypothetical protein